MYATSTRTRSFGTHDQRDRFAEKYGSADYETVGRAIAAAQPTRQEATVTEQCDNPQEHEGFPCNHPSTDRTDRATRETVERMVALAAERTPWVTEAAIFKFAATNDADTVHARLRWLESQPVAARNDVQDDIAWKQAAAAREAEQERQAYEGKTRRDEARPASTPHRTDVVVPEGRYAVTGNDGATKFYHVDRPTEGRWAGYVFVKVQAGSEYHPVKGRTAREAVLAKIVAEGIQEAMLRYGREIGKCGHCGRTLTNEESRAVGIGPVCRGKMGW